MTTPDPAQRIAAAELSAQLARQRLDRTVAALQVKLNPRRVAHRAMRDAADRGGAAAMTGAETVRRNPGTAAGVAALAAVFLARHRIAGLFRRKPGRNKTARPAVPLDPHGGAPAAS